jgi:epoxyqueuosine reductase
MNLPIEQYARLIRQEAMRLGFSFVGMAKAQQLDEAARRLEDWLNKGYAGQMGWMHNYFDVRIDPRRLVEGAQSVVSLMYNYHNPGEALAPDAPRMSQYAYGEDYHHVVRDKLKALLSFIRDEIGEVNGRCFVDSAPILEREWAVLGGLGWNGKNTLTINPKAGSWFFLAELVLDLPLVYDQPMRDYCGTCTRCIDACPTDAIAPSGYLLDATRCISYLTIELQEAIPDYFKDSMGDWMYGCDICQDVCPWNRFATRHEEPAFEPNPALATLSRRDWQELTEEIFGHVFKKSAVKRTRYAGLMRNIRFLDS